MNCCLCDAVDGKIRAGKIPKGGGVPLCTSHWADLLWRSRRPKPVQVVTFGSPSYEDVAAAPTAHEGRQITGGNKKPPPFPGAA